MTKGELEQEIVMLRQELQDYSDSLDLQRTRMSDAISMWQKSNR